MAIQVHDRGWTVGRGDEVSQRAWDRDVRYFGGERKTGNVVRPINGLPNSVCSYCRLKGLMRRARQAGEEITLDIDQRGRTVVAAVPPESAVTVPLISVTVIPRLEDHCVC